jgi:nicotinamide N-methyltransferase
MYRQPPAFPADGYDVVVLSDLLHFDQAHNALLQSLCTLLKRAPGARAYVGAGVYTRAEHCRAFLALAEHAGLLWLERGAGEDGRETDAVWRGALDVRGIDAAGLGERKGMCRWWVAGWAPERLVR